MNGPRWIRDVVGGFSAGFLAYAVVGTFVALAIIGELGRGSVCPTDVYGGVGARCVDPAAQAFWFGVADLPTVIMFYPMAVALVFLGPAASNNYAVIDGTFFLGGVGAVGLLSVAGFFAWRTRSGLVAWGLALAFVAEIAFALVWAWEHARL